jgi:predicted O-methyltransferase YrrM
MRRWGRLTGAIAYLPGELRRRVGDKRPRPSRFTPTTRFRRDWRHINRIGGWLSREGAAALHAAASRVTNDEAIVKIGNRHGRSTAALALGCLRKRTIYAVDPHTGGRSYVEASTTADSLVHSQHTVSNLKIDNVLTVVALNHDAATTYSGPRIGLLFIDGWHSTEAVLDDYASWAPYLAPGATIIFDDRRLPEVRTAILQLRPQLPRRMLEIGKLSIFTDW